MNLLRWTGWAALMLCAACGTSRPVPRPPRPSAQIPPPAASAGRLLICGAAVPVPVRVVGPKDPGGFDGALERCFFTPSRVLPSAASGDTAVPKRYGVRGTGGMSAASAARVAASGWTADLLRERVDQVLLHYDVAVTSHRCFEVLHDERGLSCHFLVDVDGTVYQTLDLVHRARHATTANDRSIGIEIAHVGAYPSESAFTRLYRRSGTGLDLVIPASLHPPPGGPFRVARPDWIRGTVHGKPYVQADFTAAQHAALAKLVPALAAAFPKVRLELPRDASGGVRMSALSESELARWSGLLGHFHVTSAKVDPGPAIKTLAESMLTRTTHQASR